MKFKKILFYCGLVALLTAIIWFLEHNFKVNTINKPLNNNEVGNLANNKTKLNDYVLRIDNSISDEKKVEEEKKLYSFVKENGGKIKKIGVNVYMYSIIIDKEGLKKLRNTNNYIVYKNEIIQAVPY